MNNLDSFELKSIEFPKVFRKTFSDRIDKRFFSILISSMLFHSIFILYFLANPVSEEHSMSRITRMQERLAKAIMERQEELALEATQFEFLGDRRIKKEEKKSDKEETAEKKTDSKKESTAETPKKTKEVASNTKPRRSAANRKSRTTQEIKASIGSKGLLGLLTSTSSVARGSEVEDILVNTVQSQTDLDKALANLSGMASNAGNGRNQGFGNGGADVKGGRSASGGGIDDLVGGLGKTKSNSIQRTGSLVVVVNETPLIEDRGKGGIKGRSPEGIQAVVLKHNKSIQYCYERELKRNPSLKGKISIRFKISPQGTIKKVEIVSSTLKNRKIEQCVLSRVRRWTDFGAIDLTYGDTTIRQIYAFGY